MIALWLWLWATLAGAHPLAPSVLIVDETGEQVTATWRQPRVRPVGERLAPALPCAPVGEPVSSADATRVQTTWTLDCLTAVGGEAGVQQRRTSGTPVLVDHRHPNHPAIYLVPPEDGVVVLAVGFTDRVGVVEAGWIGVQHLLGGTDHLLFVLGLLLAVPLRRLVGAITAFTVGHGISLAVVGTGLWVPPSGLVEVGIALSLVWLAAELLGPREALEGSVIATRPVVLCLPFGLLHGLGFAGAWLETGLGTGPLLGALFGFNLGIELGQLAVIAVALGLVEWFGRPADWVVRGAVWLGGGIAAMWVFDRLAVLF